MKCTLDVRIVCVVPEVVLCQERILQFNASAERERERDGLVQYMESLGVRGKVKIEREKKEGGGEGGEKRAHLFCSVSKCSWLISNDIVCTYIPEHAMLS